MVDKILKMHHLDLSFDEYLNLEKEVLDSHDARLIFFLALYIKKANIDLLSKKIIELGNIRYILFFMRSIKNINIEMFMEYILNFAEAKDLYYCMFDNKYLSDSYMIKIIERIEQTGDREYFYLSIYFYFVILGRFNENLFSKISKLFNEKGFELNKGNYLSCLNQLKNKMFGNIKMLDCNYESPNCYKGHGEYIPDMIVLHSTMSYEKAINNFYNPQREVSAHFIIRENGEVKEVVSLDNSSWANGTSLNDTSDVYYKFANNKIVESRAYNANYYTFSIEHISFDGRLTKEQYNSSLLVIKKIIKYVKDKYNYDFIIDREHIIGHSDINPIVRTSCPGDNFPLDKLISDLKKF